jgi:hypothetical protein
MGKIVDILINLLIFLFNLVILIIAIVINQINLLYTSILVWPFLVIYFYLWKWYIVTILKKAAILQKSNKFKSISTLFMLHLILCIPLIINALFLDIFVIYISVSEITFFILVRIIVIITCTKPKKTDSAKSPLFAVT